MYICTKCESIPSQKTSRCEWCNESVISINNNNGLLIKNIKTNWDINTHVQFMSPKTIERLKFLNNLQNYWDCTCNKFCNAWRTATGTSYGEPINVNINRKFNTWEYADRVRKIVQEMSEDDVRLIVSNWETKHPSAVPNTIVCLVNNKSVVRLQGKDIVYIMKFNNIDGITPIKGVGVYTDLETYGKSWILDLKTTNYLKDPVNKLISRFDDLVGNYA